MTSHWCKRGSSIETRLRAMSEVEESGCWEWRAARTPNGYGKLGIGKKSVSAHRASFEAFVGPIPDGYEIDHLCMNKGCINPEHLEAVEHSENYRRMLAARKWGGYATHCGKGHELTPDNTYITPRGHGRCKICMNANTAKTYRKRMARLRLVPPLAPNPLDPDGARGPETADATGSGLDLATVVDEFVAAVDAFDALLDSLLAGESA